MARAQPAVRPLLGILSGVLLALSFPYPGWGFLAPVALAPLVWAIRGSGWRRRCLLGILTGAVFASWLVYWLVYVHPAAAPLVALWFSLWFGLTAVLLGPLRSPVAMVLWLPAVWTAVEYLRSIGPLGFAWGLLGHTQWSNLPVIQIAALAGVSGVSFLLAMVNGAFAAFPVWFRRRRVRDLPALVGPFALLAAAWFGGIAALDARDGGTGQVVRLSLLQPCFTQHEKWDGDEFERVKERTYRMSEEAAAGEVDLIAWPETALPVLLNREPLLEAELANHVRKWGVPVLAGSLVEHGSGDGAAVRNAVLLFQQGTETVDAAQRYEKMHLVPWGEYVPLGRYLPFIDRLVSEEGGGGLSPGSEATVFHLDGVRFSVPVCFESADAVLVRRFVSRGAELIINITNDAWFRRSSAQDQHAIQSVFRAVENRRAVARAANTGRTCWIDPWGRLREKIPLYEPGTLGAEVPLVSGHTWYTRYGDVFAWLVLAAVAALLCYPIARERLRRRKPSA